MRIISGDFKGRRLNAPENDKVRPTTGKVKEAMFSMLMNDVFDAVVLDLFAGTGNLGLEAISRGARKCYFGDNSRESLKLVKENIRYCKAEDKAVVIPGSFEKVIDRVNEKVDIVLLDPPYRDGLMIKAIERILEQDILSEDGIVVAEHHSTEKLPERIGTLKKLKEKKYGTILVNFYGKEEEE